MFLEIWGDNIKNVGELKTRRLDKKFKTIFRILNASLYQSGHLVKNKSKILCHSFVRQRQKITG